METRVVFESEKVQKQYESLKNRKEFKSLYNSLNKAFKEISKDPSSGISLEKYRIPKDISKRFDNLWKYDLPMGWRLLYSTEADRIIIMAIILEWCDHKTYQRKYSGRK